MMPLDVGVDLDGCAYDFATSMKRYLVAIDYPGAEALPVATKVWEVWDEWGMSKDEWLDHFRNGVDAAVIFWSGPIEPGCVGALEAIRAAGHAIHIVTHRLISPRAAEATAYWLGDHKVPFDTLTFAADKTLVPTDIFIEDNLDNAKALRAAGTKVVLMDRPWNATAAGYAANFDRVTYWEEFTEHVLDLAAVKA